MTKRLAPCLTAAGVPIMRLRGAVGRVGTKVGSAAALAAVCAVVAAVGLVAAQGASSRDSARTRWFALPLGKVAALGINDRGQIAGDVGINDRGQVAGDPVEGAVLWRNGRWR